MASIVVRTKPITREKLAKFFPSNHELVRLLETLTQDVTINIPDVINPDSQTLEDAVEELGVAHALARAALALAQQANTLAQLAAEGPPPAPAVFVGDDLPPSAPAAAVAGPDDPYAQLAEMRERLAVAERVIAELKEGPTA